MLHAKIPKSIKSQLSSKIRKVHFSFSDGLRRLNKNNLFLSYLIFFSYRMDYMFVIFYKNRKKTPLFFFILFVHIIFLEAILLRQSVCRQDVLVHKKYHIVTCVNAICYRYKQSLFYVTHDGHMFSILCFILYLRTTHIIRAKNGVILNRSTDSFIICFR